VSILVNRGLKTQTNC